MAVIEEVTDETFEEKVLKSDIPVLVDFYAVGCGPCQGFEMTLNAIVDKYEGKVKFTKLDINKNHRYSRLYGATGTPSTIVFLHGLPGEKYVGACSSTTIEEHIRNSHAHYKGFAK